MKKLLTVLLVIVAALSTAFAFTACDLNDLFGGGSDTETDGDKGSADNNAANGGSTDSNNGNTSDGNNAGNNNGGSSADKDHTHSYVWKVTNPTQTVEGKSVGTCSCGDIRTKTFPALTDSRYVKGKDTATCTKNGKVEYSITIDGVKYSFTYESKATGVHNFISGVCTCGATDPNYVPHTHNYIDKSDSAGHWTECSCGDKTKLIPHSFSDDKDATHHWQVCSVKGETIGKVAHTYNNGVCTCGAVDPNYVSHTHSYIDKFNSNGHWTECSCGDKTKVIPHTYTDGKCTCGAEKPAEELDYKLNDDGTEYTVIGIGTVTSKHVIIPATYQGLPVTAIGYKAFEENGMTEITVSDSIKEIDFSFYNCNDLKKVNYTGTVSGWASIEMHTAPTGHILNNAHSLYIDGKHITEVSVDNIDFFGNGFEGSDIVSVKIGSGVKRVHGYAFEECHELVSVDIADGVEILTTGSAFRFCEKLASVKLPSNTKIISMNMFEGCEALKQINLPQALTHIDDCAFRMSGLTSITIPASVVRVGAFAFEGCEALNSVTFKDESGWHSRMHIMTCDLDSLFPHSGMGWVNYRMPFGDRELSEIENITLFLSNFAKVYNHDTALMYEYYDGNGDPQADTVRGTYDVSCNGNYFYITVEGKEYSFSLSCSLCKGDNADIEDRNGCSWGSGAIDYVG